LLRIAADGRGAAVGLLSRRADFDYWADHPRPGADHCLCPDWIAVAVMPGCPKVLHHLAAAGRVLMAAESLITFSRCRGVREATC
jgi:hypothetical protein